MKLTIVIYYSEKDTTAMLESLLNQATDNVNIIVIDDGAKCRSLDKYMADNVVIKHNSKYVGKCACYSKIIRSLKDGFIAFFDADDKVTPNFIKSVTEAITDNTDSITFGFGYSNWHKYQFKGSNVALVRPFNSIFSLKLFKNIDINKCKFNELKAKCNNTIVIDDVLYQHKRG